MNTIYTQNIEGKYTSRDLTLALKIHRRIHVLQRPILDRCNKLDNPVIWGYNCLWITCRVNMAHRDSIGGRTHGESRESRTQTGRLHTPFERKDTGVISSGIFPALLWFSQSRHGEARSQKAILMGSESVVA